VGHRVGWTHLLILSEQLFNGDTVPDLAAEVRSYIIPDFTDEANYDASFQRLLKVLRAGE